MGFTYPKFVNLGLLRMNLNKSGLGCSFGSRGFRARTTARGKNIASPVGCLQQATEQPPNLLIPDSVSLGRELAIASLVLVALRSRPECPLRPPSVVDLSLMKFFLHDA